ncbi:MAG: hypothetical protein ABEH81_01015 [Halopenitus sp.]
MEVTQIDPSINVSELNDDDLLMAHATLHSFWREMEQVGRNIEGWTMDDVIGVHQKVRSEMDQRDLKHQNLNALDDEEVDQKREAEQWAEGFVEVESKQKYLEENPVDADWFLEAVDEVQQIDESLDVGEYVTLSSVEVDQLDDEHPHEWFQSCEVDELVGYVYDEGDGVVLSKQDGEFEILSGEGSLYQSDEADKAYSTYLELSEQIRDGSSVEEATQEVLEQAPKSAAYNDDADLATIYTIAQEGSGDHVIVANAINRRSSFGISVHSSGNEFQQPEGPSLGPSHGEIGPFSAGEELLPTGIILDEPLVNGQKFFVALRDMESGDLITDDSGNFIFDSGTYWHHDTDFNQAEEVEIDGKEAYQAQVDTDSDKDWYWYQWEESEIDNWTVQQGLPNGEVEAEDDFIQYEVRDANQFDQLETKWEGQREPGDVEQLAGGEKPRRVTYGVNEDEERVVQKVEFRTDGHEMRPVILDG